MLRRGDLLLQLYKHTRQNDIITKNIMQNVRSLLVMFNFVVKDEIKNQILFYSKKKYI
jgi:hypothetical protein